MHKPAEFLINNAFKKAKSSIILFSKEFLTKQNLVRNLSVFMKLEGHLFKYGIYE